MTEDELRALAEQLVDARHRADALRDTLAEYQTEEAVRPVIAEVDRLAGLVRDQLLEVDALSRDLRDAAVEHTKATGDTDPLGNQAVYTKTFSEPVYSTYEALDWCIKNRQDLLVIDRKSFERVAKQRGLDFVRWRMEPRGYIAGDLAAKLADPGMSRADVEREVQRAQHTSLREVMENEG